MDSFCLQLPLSLFHLWPFERQVCRFTFCISYINSTWKPQKWAIQVTFLHSVYEAKMLLYLLFKSHTLITWTKTDKDSNEIKFVFRSTIADFDFGSIFHWTATSKHCIVWSPALCILELFHSCSDTSPSLLWHFWYFRKICSKCCQSFINSSGDKIVSFCVQIFFITSSGRNSLGYN